MKRRALANLMRVLTFVAIVVGVYWLQDSLGFQERLDPEVLRAGEVWTAPWIGGYLLFWIVANSVLWPTLAGGALFGWAGGTVLGLIGAALAAVVQLSVVRLLLRDPVEAWFGERVEPIRIQLEERGLAVLVVWRLMWLPVSALTMAVGLTRIPIRHHVLAVLAMIPGMLALNLVSDSLVLFGPAAIPPARWALLIALFGGGFAVWWLAQRRWPQLRVVRPR